MARDKQSTAFDDVIEKEADDGDAAEKEADDAQQSDTSSDAPIDTDTTTESTSEDVSSDSDTTQSEDASQSDPDTTSDRSSQSDESSTESTESHSDDSATDSDSTSSDATDSQDTTDTQSLPPVSESEPEFPYSDADQHPLYMRSDAWNALHDVKFHTEATLLEKYGIRNVETRELDEAIARLIAETVDTEVLAEKVIEIRGYDPETLTE